MVPFALINFFPLLLGCSGCHLLASEIDVLPLKVVVSPTGAAVW